MPHPTFVECDSAVVSLLYTGNVTSLIFHVSLVYLNIGSLYGFWGHFCHILKCVVESVCNHYTNHNDHYSQE